MRAIVANRSDSSASSEPFRSKILMFVFGRLRSNLLEAFYGKTREQVILNGAALRPFSLRVYGMVNEGDVMRAEIERAADEIKQALALLRRHL